MRLCVCLQTRFSALWVLITTTSHNGVNTSIENREREKKHELCTKESFNKEDNWALILLYKHTQLVRRSGDHSTSCWILKAEHNLSKVSWVIESGKRKKTESAMPVLTDSDVYYGLVRISSLNSQFKVSASGWVGICVCARATKMNSQQNLNIKRLRVKALFESDFKQIYNPNSRNVGTFLKTWIKLQLKDFQITWANIVFTIEHREHNKCLNWDIFYSNSKNVPTFLEFGLYICNFFLLTGHHFAEIIFALALFQKPSVKHPPNKKASWP